MSFLAIWHEFLTYKCTWKPFLGNLFVVDRIFFGRISPDNIQYCHLWNLKTAGSWNYWNFCEFFWLYPQRIQTSLRRLQDISKRSRRLRTKEDVVTTSGKRRRIYDVLKTSDLRHFETSNLGRLQNVWFITSPGRLVYDVLKTSDLRRFEDVCAATSQRRL